MKNILKPTYAALSILILTATAAYGQQTETKNSKQAASTDKTTGTVSGTVTPLYSEAQRNFGTTESTDGGVVCLMNATDTLFTVAFKDKFTFEKAPLGKATVKFMHINFEPFETDITVKKETQCRLFARMKSQIIESITVKGEMPLVSVINDTVRFNAAAIKMMEGEMAIDFLKQIPGAEVTESGIQINSKQIQRTYVNKRQVFGSDIMAALKNIPIEEVQSIDTYEELSPKLTDQLNNTEQVLNIRTKNPMISAVAGNVLASYGGSGTSDFNPKYHVGAVGNFFSEKLLFSGNILYGNMNRRSNNMREISDLGGDNGIDNRRLFAEVGIDKSWSKEDGAKGNDRRIDLGNMSKLSVHYSLDRDRSLSESWSERIYLPSAEYASRYASDSLVSRSSGTSHAINTSYEISRSSWTLNISNNLNLSDRERHSMQTANTMLNDDVLYNKVTSDNNSLSNSSDHNVRGIYRANNVFVMTNVSYRRSSGQSDGLRIDSLSSTPLRTITETTPPSASHKLNASARVTWQLKPFSLAANYNYSYDYGVNRRTAIDMTDPANPVTDLVNTYDYTRNFHRHEGGLNFGYYKPKAFNVNATLRGVASEVVADDRFPSESRHSKMYSALLPELMMSISGKKSEIALNYRTDITLPSVEQWRDQLETSNPTMLRAGNPNLRNSYQHAMSFNIFPSPDLWRTKKSFYTFGVSLNIIENTIASKSQYFTTETLIPEYGYTAQPQTTFTTYENMGSTRSGNVNCSIGGEIKPLRTNYNIGASMNYNSYPSYFQQTSVRTESYSPSLRASLTIRPTKQTSLSMSGNANYVSSGNTLGQTNRTMRYGGNCSLDQNYRIFFGRAQYNFSYYQALDGVIGNQFTNILNASVGVKLLRGDLQFSFTAHDILNNNTPFNMSVTDNYVLNSWKRIYGRFYTFNIGWKLFRSQKGITEPKGLRMNTGWASGSSDMSVGGTERMTRME